MQTLKPISTTSLTMHRIVGLLAACVFLATTSMVHAQDEQERANARAAANAGADAFESKDYEKAITYFERAQSQYQSSIHLWYIARAANEVGKLVKAREACLKVIREGAPEGSSDTIVRANSDCEEILEALKGVIPSLTVNVEGVADGTEFRVLRNGEPVPRAVIGIPAPVDPGEHTFTASAEGYAGAEQTITLAKGASETITLTLSPSVSGDSVAPAQGEPAGESRMGVDSSSAGLPRPYWPAFVAWGVGLAGIGTGVVFGLSANGKANEADELCGGSRDECFLDEGSSDARRVNELNDQAGTNQTMGLIGYGVGGALIATGVVFWLLEVGGPNTAKNASQRHFRPVVGPSHVGLVGTF